MNSPKGPGNELIVPGNLDDSCNVVNFILSVEGKTYTSFCDTRGWITLTVNVEMIIWLIFLLDLGWNDSPRLTGVWFCLLNRRHRDPFVTNEVELQWQWKLNCW